MAVKPLINTLRQSERFGQYAGTSLQDQYFKGQMVLIDGWLMSAIEDNTEYPAPIPLGDPEYTLPNNPAWTGKSNTSIILSGHKYTFSQGGWVQSIRVFAPDVGADISYRVIVSDVTNPSNPIVDIIENPILTKGEWSTVALSNAVVGVGTILVITLECTNSSSVTTFTDNWAFEGNNNNDIPPSSFWNKRTQNNIVRFNHQSIGANYASQLTNLIPNSTITINVNGSPSDYQTYLTGDLGDTALNVTELPVTLIDAGGSIDSVDECDCLFSSPVSSPTDYVEQTATIPSVTWASIEGVLEFDGVDQSGGANTYGVDIKFQKAEIPTKWGVMAYSPDLSQANQNTLLSIGDFNIIGGDYTTKSIGMDLIVFLSHATTYTLPEIADIRDINFFLNFKNTSIGVVTIQTSGSDTIEGVASQNINAGDSLKLVIDGEDFKIM